MTHVHFNTVTEMQKHVYIKYIPRFLQKEILLFHYKFGKPIPSLKRKK